MGGRHLIVGTLLAALAVCAGCNLLGPPPPAVPATPVAAPAAGAAPAGAANAPTAAGAGGGAKSGFCGKLASGFRTFIDRIRNRIGLRFPGLEAKPPLRAIADPANKNSPTPAVAAAAKVKEDEDRAEQKIKALRYLATIGCSGCHPEVADALLAALDDCTEEVRYEAVRALREAVGCCAECNPKQCCTPKIMKRLGELAMETTNGCCPKEPSARVRRLARIVLNQCAGTPTEAPKPQPNEGPSREPERAGAVAGFVPVSPDAADNPSPDHTPRDPWAGVPQWPRPGTPDDLPLAANTDRVLATVNGQPICERDLEPDVQSRVASLAIGLSESQREPVYRKVLWEELGHAIDRTLLRQHPDNAAVTPPVNTYVSDGEVRAYYRARFERFEQPVEVRWECITATKARFSGTKERAVQILSYLRNRASGVEAERPVPFDPRAVTVQTFGWTRRQEVASERIAEVLFRMPTGDVSSILEDDTGWHVVRVQERRPARPIPLRQVAEQIRGEIRQQRQEAQRARYLAELRRRADIWTMFGGPESRAPILLACGPIRRLPPCEPEAGEAFPGFRPRDPQPTAADGGAPLGDRSMARRLPPGEIPPVQRMY
jgi:hypothetical protein